MDAVSSSYLAVINSLIAKHTSVLGPDITMAKVRRIPEIHLDASGAVVDVTGNAQEALSRLISQFAELSAHTLKKTLESIVASGTQAQHATTTQVMQQAHQTPQASMPTVNGEVVDFLNRALSGMNAKAT